MKINRMRNLHDYNLACLTELTKSSDTLKVYLRVNNTPYLQVWSPELHLCHKIHPQDHWLTCKTMANNIQMI